MNYSSLFDEKPESWGLRGDPYFWDYLKNRADGLDDPSPEALEAWIKREFLVVSGEELTPATMVRVEQFEHGGMSSGGLDGEWWLEQGIPMLKERLLALSAAT